jgi:hypothetical protein
LSLAICKERRYPGKDLSADLVTEPRGIEEWDFSGENEFRYW